MIMTNKNIPKRLSTFILLLCLSAIINSCSIKKIKKDTKQPQQSNNHVVTRLKNHPDKKPYLDFIISNLEDLKKDKKESILFLEKASSRDKDSLFLEKKLARELLSANQTDKAKKLIKELSASYPKDVDILGLKAAMYILNNRPLSDIIEIYKTIILIDHDNQKATIALGYLFEKTGKSEELIREFKKISLKTEKNFFLYLYLGKALLKEKKYDKAKKYLEKAVHLNKNQLEAKRLLIESLKKSSDSDRITKKIISLYKDIINANHNNIKPIIDLAFYYRQCGRLKDSNREFKNLISKWPSQKKQISSVILFMIKKKNDYAVKLLSNKIYEESEDDSIYMITADLYNRSGKKNKALDFYDKILPNSNFYISAISLKAYIYTELKNVDKAVKILTASIKRFPDSSQLLMTLGNIFEEIKNFDEAEKIYQKGTTIESEQLWRFLFRLGVVLDKKGDKKRAIRSMKKASTLNSDNPNILNYLGYTYANMGINLNEAEKLLLKALKLKPKDGYITDSLGWLYFKKNNLEKAKLYLKKAYSLIKDDAVILEHMGDLNKRINNIKKAIKFYNASLELNPENKQVRNKLKKIQK